MEVHAVPVFLALAIILELTYAILIAKLRNILIWPKEDAIHVHASVTNVYLEVHARAALQVPLIIQLARAVTQIVIQPPIGTSVLQVARFVMVHVWLAWTVFHAILVFLQWKLAQPLDFAFPTAILTNFSTQLPKLVWIVLLTAPPVWVQLHVQLAIQGINGMRLVLCVAWDVLLANFMIHIL